MPPVPPGTNSIVARGGENDDRVGGLVGISGGSIIASYATGNVDGGNGKDFVGGLVGDRYEGTIVASYATGNANGGTGNMDKVGGLVGEQGRGSVTASYAFGMVAGDETIGNTGSPIPPGVNTSYDLTAGNAGASWNTAGAWNFGTGNQNPALVYADYDGGGAVHACNKYPSKIPGTTTTLTCGSTLVGDYRYPTEVTPPIDVDHDGLIEIRNLDMLNNIRHNLAGTSYKTSSGGTGNTTGASASRPSNCIGRTTTTNLCGYELVHNLDFANATHYASGSVDSNWRPNNSNPDRATNAGFPGFGAAASPNADAGRRIVFGFTGFTAIFEGNGHTIRNLYSRASNVEASNVGLFRLVQTSGIIRNVGVIDVDVYGANQIYDRVGGLAGRNEGAIIASHATGNADGEGGNSDIVGSLVGYNLGRITASYASGSPSDRDGVVSKVGGLVGK